MRKAWAPSRDHAPNSLPLYGPASLDSKTALIQFKVLRFQSNIPIPLERLTEQSGFSEITWTKDCLIWSISLSHGKWCHVCSPQRTCWSCLWPRQEARMGEGGSGHLEPTNWLPQVWAYSSRSLLHDWKKSLFSLSHLFYRWEDWGPEREEQEQSTLLIALHGSKFLNYLLIIYHTLPETDTVCVCVCVLYAHGYQWSRDRVFVMFSFFSYILQIIKHNGLDFSMC